jgi:tRNA threonylcarbamoyladenosine biosynthesis protein TsaB
MHWILHIDTATTWCSVALSKNNQQIALKEACSNENGKYIHSEKLHVFIHEILTENQLSPKNLSAISVSNGPGSYTGLRIGMATAKGLAAGLNIPLITLDTLQTMCVAAQKKGSFTYFLPLIDARRMECFSAVYKNDLSEYKGLFSLILTELNDFELPNFCFFGDGADKGIEILEAKGGTFIPNIHCSASNLIELAFQKFLNQDFADPILSEPLYGKEFMAGIPKKKL